MKFDEVHTMVAGIPFISERKARFLYEMIVNEKRTDILELGIAHGAATCYIAAALDELGEGLVTAVDLLTPEEDFDPSAEELVTRCGLERYVDIVRMKTGYNWFLHDKIAEQTSVNECKECYDLCIIDGPKNWTIDGAAFFLVDKLLVDGGKIIFDDYNWTYAEADSRRDVTDGITHRSLSAAERETPHIREIVHLLVMQHPNYGKTIMLDDASWVIVEKEVGAERKTVVFARTITLEEILSRAVRFGRRGVHAGIR
ncbi:MAG: class I SAM-dependent methyltransferase [Rhodospirillaceae bacterium]